MKQEKLYKKKDFTPASVELLYGNFSSGMIKNYLDNYLERNRNVPIVENPIFDWSLAK